jgi:hypothetical protein
MTQDYISAQLIRDQKGQIVPNQYYNTVTKKFQVYTESQLPSGESSNLIQISDADGNLLIVNEDGSINSNISDNETRKLGEVKKIVDAIDILDDEARKLGEVKKIVDAIDILDNETRKLGEIEKIIQAVEVKQNNDYPDGASFWSLTEDSSIDTSISLTKVAEVGKIHYITGFLVAVTAGPIVGDTYVQINNGADLLWNDVIGNEATQGERIGAMFAKPLVCAVNTDVTLFVGSGGTGVIMKLTLLGYTKEV